MVAELIIAQVYESAVDLAASGKAGNQTASDIRAIVYLAYLSSSPNFPGLNQALDLAVNEGNWTALTYASYELIYTPAFFEVLPTICLDQSKSHRGWTKVERNSLLCRS